MGNSDSKGKKEFDKKKNWDKELIVAAAKNDVEGILDALKNGAKLDYAYAGSTALHRAAELGHVKACETLLSKCANVNGGDSSAYTPLHLAAANGHLVTCKYLVSKGAKVNARTNAGDTPLHCAALGGKEAHLEVCRYLIESGCDKTLKNNNGEDAYFRSEGYCRKAFQ